MLIRIFPEQTVDEEFKTLGDLGYTGNLNDRIVQYLIAEGLGPSLADGLYSLGIAPQIITVAGAGIDPTNSEALFVGDIGNDITNNTTFLTNSNYESSAGIITSVAYQINEVNAVGTAPLADGDTVSYLVTDSAANTRRFYVDTNVTHVAPVAAGGLVDQTYDLNSAISTLDTSSDFIGSAITYALAPSSGSLPTGLSLATNGQITGTPTVEVGPVTIIIRGTNTGGFADSAFDITVAENLGFSVEEDGLEPVITATNGNVSVTIGSGIYAGTYTQRVTDSATLTVAMIEAAPTPIVLPTISGTETEGQTLTATPGLWLYDGADPGDQTWAWQNDTSGSLGDTDLSYTLVTSDVGDTISIDETFNGVTISSASTGTIAPITPAWVPTDLGAKLKGFWDFSDTSQLYQNTGGTTAVASDGDPVRLVNDQSSANNDIIADPGHTWNATTGRVDMTVTSDLREEGWIPASAFSGLSSTGEIYILGETSDVKWMAMFSDDVGGATFVGVAQSGSGSAPNLITVADYTSDNVVITATTRNELSTEWSDGVERVFGARGVDMTGFNGQTGGFLQWQSDGFGFAGSIGAIILTDALTAQERTDLHGWMNSL